MSRYKEPGLGNSLRPPKAKSFRCPSWMGDDARELWRDLAPQLLKLGVLTDLDRPAFTTLCVTYGRLRQIEREFATAVPLVSDGRGGFKKNPLDTIYKGTCETFRKLAADFGLTPVSRGRVSVDPISLEEDPGAEFFGSSNIADIRQAKE